MNLMGYLVTLYNIQSFSESGGPLKDIAVRVSEVHRLADELRSLPDFPIEGFRKTGFYRVENVGKYISNNLRDYMYNKGDVNPRDEGVILTLTFDNILGYFNNQRGTEGATTFYRTKPAPAAASSSASASASAYDEQEEEEEDDDNEEVDSGYFGRQKRAVAA